MVVVLCQEEESSEEGSVGAPLPSSPMDTVYSLCDSEDQDTGVFPTQGE